MNLSNEPLSWIVRIKWGSQYLTVITYYRGEYPIKPDIHHLPGHHQNLEPGRTCIFFGDDNLKNFLGWCTQICSDPDGSLKRLLDEYVTKHRVLDIKFTYDQNGYSIEMEGKRWVGTSSLEQKGSKSSSEPLRWVVQIRCGDRFVTMIARNQEEYPIKPEIHHLPGQGRDLELKRPFYWYGEQNLKAFLEWCNEVCPDPNRERAKLVDEHITKHQNFDIWFTYKQNKYAIEIRPWLKDRNENTNRPEMPEVQATPLQVVHKPLQEMFEKEMGALEKKVQDYERGVKRLHSTLQEREETWNKEKDELNSQIERYKRELADLQTARHESYLTWEKENRALKGQIAKYKNEVERLREERQRVEEVSQKLKEAMEEAQKSRTDCVGKVDELQQKTREKLELHHKNREAYRELLRALGVEDESLERSPGLEDTLKELKALRDELVKMSFVTYFIRLRDIENRFDQLRQEARKEIRLDTTFIDLLNRLRENKRISNLCPYSEEQITSLRDFAEGMGFKLIWPCAGEELVSREHRVLFEEKAGDIGRGRVVRALTPGLQRGKEIVVKAGIVLAL